MLFFFFNFKKLLEARPLEVWNQGDNGGSLASWLKLISETLSQLNKTDGSEE